MAAVTTIRASSQNSATSGTALTVAAPTGTTAGDVVIVTAHANTQTTIVDNNGATPFTADLSNYKPNTSSGHVISVFSRRIIAGDPTTFAFTSGATGRWSLIAVTFQNPHPTAIYDVTPASGTSQNLDSPPGSGNVVCPTITTLTPNAIHIASAFIDASIDDFDVWPSGYTIAQSVDNNQGQSFGSKVIASPAATGAQTFEHNGSGTAYIGTSYAIKDASNIAFDAASNSGYQAAASTYSQAHVITPYINRYLVVGVSMLSLAQTVTSIKWNTTESLTFLGSQNSVSGACRVELWGIIAPTAGSFNIDVVLSGAIASAACAVSFTGVHQTSPTEGFAGAQATNVGAADATVDVTTVATNDWVIDQVATDDTAITVGAGQTSRNNVTGAGGSGADSTEPDTTPSTVTMSWTNVAALATWSIAAIAIRDVNAVSLAVASSPSVFMTTNTKFW